MTPNELFDRLCALARRAPEVSPNELRWGLETSVLAHWREAAGAGSANASLLRGLRWAALTACVVALLVAAFESEEVAAFQNRFEPETRIAESAISAGYE